MRITLPRAWRRHCSTVAASPKHGTARCLSPPKNTPCVEWGGEGNRLCSPWRRPPSTALQFTLTLPPPPSEKPNIRVIGEGGGQGVFTVASPRHGTANHQPPPPPLRRTKHSCDGGGEGVFIMGSFKQTLNVAYPPLTKPWRRTNTALNVPYPHPNHTSCPGNKNYIRLTYFR
jgi:hypothetical protein